MPTTKHWSSLMVGSTLKRPAGRGMKNQKNKRHQKASNSQPVSTDSENQEQKGPPVNIHPKFVTALSQFPYSPFFGVLWPSIVEQASFETRNQLCKVNTYFETLCQPYKHSDLAKRSYASHYGNSEKRKGLPSVLDLSFDAEWRCWGATGCSFNSIETFRAFCAVGDIDLDQKSKWNPHAYLTPSDHDFWMYWCVQPPGSSSNYIWMSRTKDVVFETWLNPLEGGGHCRCIGLTGVADKAIAMYNFMHGNRNEESAELGDGPATRTTTWRELVWKRED